jgi:hypothetical protein
MLSNGWGVEKDGPRAATLIRQAAEKGFANAQAVMGFAHVTGTWLVGVPESDTESFRWFMLAAKQGETTAQRQVGQRYEKGWGVKQDLVEAVKWYKLAADSGNAVALGNLGIMHLRGRGVPRDPDKGIQLMKTAVKQGNANIALMLAEVCMTGDGAPKDDVQAYAWAQIATTVQYPPNAKIAVELRNQIGESLTPAQRRKAEQLASLWSAPPIR